MELSKSGGNTANPLMAAIQNLGIELSEAELSAASRAVNTSGGGSDLYTPTYQLFASSPDRLTLNGCHLNDSGYRKLADIISRALLGTTVAADADLARVREGAVPAGEADPYRVTGAEDDRRSSAEDTGDDDRFDD